MRKKEKKQPTRRSKIIKTVISLILIAVMVAAIVAANTLLTDNNRMVNAMMGANDSVIDNSGVDTKGLDRIITRVIIRRMRSERQKMLWQTRSRMRVLCF